MHRVQPGGVTDVGISDTGPPVRGGGGGRVEVKINPAFRQITTDGADVPTSPALLRDKYRVYRVITRPIIEIRFFVPN